MYTTSFIFSTFVAAVSAHQNFHQFWVNGETPGYQVGIRMPPSNSPVTDVTSNDIACNVDGSTVPSGVDTVAANEGDTIKVQWDQSGHPGPITHFLFGPVDDASQATGVGSWIKIDEVDYVDGKWANEIMSANNMTHEFSLPTGLASGEYLLRSEMLALHGAQTVGGAQFYIGCAQLKITGTGAEGSCTPSIELPGAYNAEDDNIYIPNVYNGFDPTTYTAPGGAVATCGGSGGSTPVTSKAPAVNSTASATPTAIPITGEFSTIAPISSSTVSSIAEVAISSASASSVLSTSAASINATSTAPVRTTFATLIRTSSGIAAPTGGPSPTGGAGGSVPKWHQCGGINFSGPTACESGSTCTKQNDYYHQCV